MWKESTLPTDHYKISGTFGKEELFQFMSASGVKEKP
jgi:hypothetical protein